MGVSNMFWRSFGEFAADVDRLPEGAINPLIEQHRRRRTLRNSATGRKSPAGSRHATRPLTAMPQGATSANAADNSA